MHFELFLIIFPYKNVAYIIILIIIFNQNFYVVFMIVKFHLRVCVLLYEG